MNRIVITIILLGSLFCLSGCIEAEYKTEVKIAIGKKKPTPAPRIIGNGYPNSLKPTTIPTKYQQLMNKLAGDRQKFEQKRVRVLKNRQRQQKAKTSFANFTN